MSAFIDSIIPQLGNSTHSERQQWAKDLINQRISPTELIPYFKSSNKLNLRICWFISDIGHTEPSYLKQFLPDLWVAQKQIRVTVFTQAFASYWKIAGIPAQNQGEAFDHLLHIIGEPSITNTLKERALDALYQLIETQPQLLSEALATLAPATQNATIAIKKRFQSLAEFNAR